jgi:hypothetical protein
MPDDGNIAFALSGRDAAWSSAWVFAVCFSVFVLIHYLLRLFFPDMSLNFGTAIGMGVSFGFMSYLMRRVAYVSSEGIAGPNREIMRWAAISSVDSKFARFPGGYVAVQSDSGSTVILASAIVRNPHFRAAVLDHAPPNNPLAAVIQRGLLIS